VVARQLDDPQHSINVRNLTLSLGPPGRERRILNGVDLKIRRGSLHMLLGPNGCGKSTLLKVLGGLIPSYEGAVETDQPTGFVFQNPDHQVVMPTVAADVAFGLGR
jgi:energy-coupling factor transporter ATP-binding protein EcfA2